VETFQWKLSLGAIPKTGTVFRIKNEESSRDDKTRQFYWRLGRTRHAARGLCALIKEAVNPGWFFAVLTLMVPPKRSLRVRSAGSVERCGPGHLSGRLLRRRVHEAHADGYPVTAGGGTARYVQGWCTRIAGPSRGRAGCAPAKSLNSWIRGKYRELRPEADPRAPERAQGQFPLEIGRTAREQQPSL